MHIQHGKLYENKTWRYLYPCLKFYDKELLDYLFSFFKLAVGINDHNLKECEGRFIFILIDTKIAKLSQEESIRYRNNFAKFLEWLQNKYYYENDYIYDDQDGREQHMIVLRVPLKFEKAYDHFKKGEYSKMYAPRDIDHYFSLVTLQKKDVEIEVNNRIKRSKQVLNRDPSYLEEFVKDVNKRFNTTVESFYFKDAELDYPPTMDEEIFNYIEDLCQEIEEEKKEEETDLILESQDGV